MTLVGPRRFSSRFASGDDPYILGLMATAKASAGEKDAALQILTELDQISQHPQVLAYWRTLLSGNSNGGALHWLEQSFEERDGSNRDLLKVESRLNHYAAIRVSRRSSRR
jgi:hypothetical protein